MALRVAGGHQRHVVDVGDAGRHAAPVHPEAALRHGRQVGRGASIQIFGVKPVNQHYYDRSSHIPTPNLDYPIPAAAATAP